MNLAVVAGPGNPGLGQRTAAALGAAPAPLVLERFPDGELYVRVDEGVRGADVYLVQPTCPPVDARLLELLLLADACRLAGAARLTAVVPYLGYARQDRRTAAGEPLGARLAATLLGASGIDRLVAVDLHQPAIESAFPVPVVHLSAVPLLADAIRAGLPEGVVVVSPDLGAVRLAERYARILRAPAAVVHKTRLSGAEVAVRAVIGEVRGLAPLVVDDMITTGGTIQAAVRALLEAGCRPEVAVVATHALLVAPAAERLAGLPLRRVIATDSVPGADRLPVALERVGLAPLLADAIGRLHGERPVDDLLREA